MNRRHFLTQVGGMALAGCSGQQVAAQTTTHDRFRYEVVHARPIRRSRPVSGPDDHTIETLFRLFRLKGCHGWAHEIVVVGSLAQHPTSAIDSVWSGYRISQYRGAGGTSASLLVSETPSRQQHERFSSNRGMRVSQSRASRNAGVTATTTRVRNRILTTD